MRFWRTSTKGFILVRTLLFFMFIIQYTYTRSLVSLHIASENTLDLGMENFSFFEATILDKIADDIKSMNYSDFEIKIKEFVVQVTYNGQTAILDFDGSVDTSMILEFDDLVPCFTSYEVVKQE